MKQPEINFQMSYVRRSVVNNVKDIICFENAADEFKNALTCAQNCVCHFSLILRGQIKRVVFGKIGSFENAPPGASRK